MSSAISIGSGGPFGAEGPIIMTGGAIGSLIAQFFHLTSAERKTLLVAGAAAGMSATFAAPVAAVLLAVELLLFEWKPRSMIPVALASATAAGDATLHPRARSAVPGHRPSGLHRSRGLPAASSRDCSPARLSALLTLAVYAAEDALPALADSLDVVAGNRRPRHRSRRLRLPAGAGRRLRHDRQRCFRETSPARSSSASWSSSRSSGRCRWDPARRAASWRRC